MSEHHPGHEPSHHDDDPYSMETEQERADRYYKEAARLYLDNIWADTSKEHTHDQADDEARVAFETAYAGSYDDEAAFMQHMANRLGWYQVLDEAIARGGIPPAVLAWNGREIYKYISRYFHILHGDTDALHVFTEPGIRPLAPAAGNGDGTR